MPFGYPQLYANGLNNNTQIRRSTDMIYQRGGTYSVTLTGDTYQVAALNFGTQLNANDYVEIAWQSDDASTQLVYEAPSGNITAVPSVIATIQQVR